MVLRGVSGSRLSAARISVAGRRCSSSSVSRVDPLRAHEHAQPQRLGPRKGEDQLEDVHLGAGDGGVEGARVERHRQRRTRTPRRLQRTREDARVRERGRL